MQSEPFFLGGLYKHSNQAAADELRLLEGFRNRPFLYILCFNPTSISWKHKNPFIHWQSTFFFSYSRFCLRSVFFSLCLSSRHFIQLREMQNVFCCFNCPWETQVEFWIDIYRLSKCVVSKLKYRPWKNPLCCLTNKKKRNIKDCWSSKATRCGESPSNSLPC